MVYFNLSRWERGRAVARKRLDAEYAGTDTVPDDFNTANVYNRTGGLDASIGFEATRDTNKGPMVPDSMYFFGFFVSDVVSSMCYPPQELLKDMINNFVLLILT